MITQNNPLPDDDSALENANMSSLRVAASDRDNSMSPDTRRESPLTYINDNNNSMVYSNNSMSSRVVII